MSRTLVTGATGTLGTALRPRLRAAGHTVRAAYRSLPEEPDRKDDWIKLDLREDANITSALENIDVVIHTATAPQGDTEAVDVQGTKRLLNAAETADVAHFIFPSIVGIDTIPFSYYNHKATAEQAVNESSIPTTIIRATQFHSFVAELLDYVAKLPVWPLPTRMQIQPVDVGEVADVIVDHANLVASGHSEPIGGPEIHSVRELAETYRDQRGLRRPILRLPLPSETIAAFRAGHATCPKHMVGTVTWEEWLSKRYTNGT